MTARITDTDKGLADVASRLIGKMRVRVGILANASAGPSAEDRAHAATHGGRDQRGRFIGKNADPKASGSAGASLIEIAAIQEFGAPAAGIPQRSFIRGTVDAGIAEIHATQATLAKQIVRGTIDGRTAMERLGISVVAMIQRRISAGIAPPNAPSTIAHKGSSVPLIDTGGLRSAVTYQVEGDK